MFELAQSSPYPQIPYSCLLSLPHVSVFETLPSLLSVPSVSVATSLSAATSEVTPEVNSKITPETKITSETTPKTTDNSALLQLLFNRVKASTSKEEIHFWSQMCCCAVGRIEKRKVVRVETPVARQNTPLVLQNDSWLSRLKSLHDVSVTLPSLPQCVSRQALIPRLISLLSSFPSIAYVPALNQHNSLRYLESVDLEVDSYSFPSNFILVVVPPFPPTNHSPSREHNPISFSSTFPSFVVTPIPRSHFSISLPSFPPSPISTFRRNSPFSPCCRKSA